MSNKIKDMKAEAVIPCTEVSNPEDFKKSIINSVTIMNLDTQTRRFSDISENTKCSLVRVPCFVLVSSLEVLIFNFFISVPCSVHGTK